MKLLNTYEDKDEAEEALTKISGEKILASAIVLSLFTISLVLHHGGIFIN